jgi:protoheme IX farnesyltransferase
MTANLRHSGVATLLRQFTAVCKLRIGTTIAYTALAGIAITPGPALEGWRILMIGLAVLIASASAGGFNQYLERDLDMRMARTRNRPFVTGELAHQPVWAMILWAMQFAAFGMAWWATNLTAAIYVALGSFFYVAVYTVWLKRRSSANIVIGGLAGSFAVLAGAAAVDPGLSILPVLLATVLFLWTPPHFWSLAIAMHDDYAAAGVPMLPVVVGDCVAARIVFGQTIVLVLMSLTPVLHGMGWIYLTGAVLGGGLFLHYTHRLAANPNRATAMASFHASLGQLTLLLTAAILDSHLLS